MKIIGVGAAALEGPVVEVPALAMPRSMATVLEVLVVVVESLAALQGAPAQAQAPVATR
jgi:hypothetical protein